MENKEVEKINPDRIYTSEEAAALLQVDYQTVTRYCKAGKIKAAKVRGYRILGSSLLAFLHGE